MAGDTAKIEMSLIVRYDASLIQPPDSLQAGTWRQVNPFRQILVSDSPVFLQGLQNAQINFV